MGHACDPDIAEVGNERGALEKPRETERAAQAHPEGVRPPTVVEFLGISGAGKSTLFSAAIDRLRSQDRAVLTLEEASHLAFRQMTRDPLWRSLLRPMPASISHRIWRHAFNRSQDRYLAIRDMMLSNPEAVEVVMATARRRRDIEIRPDLVIGRWVTLAVDYSMAKRALPPGSVLVIDEGFVNRAVSLFGYRFSDADRLDLARYVRSVPAPDLVLHVDTAPDVAERRMKKWTSRMADQDHATRQGFLDGSALCVAAVLEILEEIGVPVARIPNADDPVGDAIERMEEALDRLPPV